MKIFIAFFLFSIVFFGFFNLSFQKKQENKIIKYFIDRIVLKATATSCSENTFGSGINPTGDPIGGGAGYSKIIDSNKATYIVGTKEELLSKLASAKFGQIIYVDDNAQIDLTGSAKIEIPAGVVLASGRGNGDSNGALLYSHDKASTVEEEWYSLFEAGGNGVRITGLRLEGNDSEVGDSPSAYKLAIGIWTTDYDIEVDNNELKNWSYAAVMLRWDTKNSHIHHNYIHHNRRTGYGYGVDVSWGAIALIEANLFNYNRHSIVGGAKGTGYSGYTARYNTQLEEGNSHAFDIHGTGSDGYGGTAGSSICIYNNTFKKIVDPINGMQRAVAVRGTPLNGAWIKDNFLFYNIADKDFAVVQQDGAENMNVYNNCYNNSLDSGQAFPIPLPVDCVPPIAVIPTIIPTPVLTPNPSLHLTPAPSSAITATPTLTPTPAPKFSADLNSDGKVNAQDFAILMSAWNSIAKPKADINQDGLVDSLDFGLMMSFWG